MDADALLHIHFTSNTLRAQICISETLELHARLPARSHALHSAHDEAAELPSEAPQTVLGVFGKGWRRISVTLLR